MDLKDIKAIIDLMRKNSLTEFELEKQDFKIKLKRGGGPSFAASLDDSDPSHTAGRPGSPSSHPGAVLLPAPSPALPVALVPPETEIRSPMIGTFYLAPSPEAAHYVEVGTEIGADTVVCIIEAMKVMNEIKAETRGVVTAILADNGKPVEFGQLLFRVRPT
jgi:acetyl-CoA carboxylase biotin carboxyl carrier protein